MTRLTFARRTFLLWAGAASLAPASRTARAAAYPAQPIRLVVPYPPGGIFDALARPLAERMSPVLGTIFIENVSGGGGSLGAAMIARAQPDGYSLLVGGTNQFVTEALLKNRPLYDPLEDLTPISNIATATFAVVVHPELPVHTLNDLVDYSKANPGKLSYGSAGTGTLNHLTGELLKQSANLADMTHVPYRGAGPALSDVISGHVPMIIAAMSGQVLEFHRSGKVRILAVANPTRLAAAPELPTAVESGFPRLVAAQSIGLLARTGTPPAIIEHIAQAAHKALADRDFQQMLVAVGLEPALDSAPESFRRSLAEDVARWKPVANTIGLKID